MPVGDVSAHAVGLVLAGEGRDVRDLRPHGLAHAVEAEAVLLEDHERREPLTDGAVRRHRVGDGRSAGGDDGGEDGGVDVAHGNSFLDHWGPR